jgi:hypothetical protein
MGMYRYCFHDRAQGLKEMQELNLAHDKQAIDNGAAIIAGHESERMEIWRGACLVQSFEPASSLDPNSTRRKQSRSKARSRDFQTSRGASLATVLARLTARCAGQQAGADLTALTGGAFLWDEGCAFNSLAYSPLRACSYRACAT